MITGKDARAGAARDMSFLAELDFQIRDNHKLTSEVWRLEDENAKLRELVRDMLPFAEVGMDDTCVTRRCCLYEQCEYVVGVKCTIEQHMLDRMRELGVVE